MSGWLANRLRNLQAMFDGGNLEAAAQEMARADIATVRWCVDFAGVG